MSRMFRKSLFALALGVAAVGPVHATDLIVFGDSLSDGGAGIAIANGLCREASFGALACGKKRDSVTLGAPYFEQRSFTDGPVAVDVMARLFGKTLSPGYRNALVPSINRVGQNYAIAGARAHGTGTAELFALDAQILAYATHYKRAQAETLHVILIGGNDLASAIPHNDTAAVTRAVGAIQSGVNKLAAIGAKRILVYKLLPMHDVPRLAAQPALKANAAALTAQFNAGIDALRTPAGVTLLRFDMTPTWNVVKQQLWSLGKEYETACATGTGELTDLVKKSPDANVVLTGQWLSACTPDKRQHRAFFDDLHPSGYVHQMIGQATYDFVFESLNGGRCAVHRWGSETVASRGSVASRQGLPGTVRLYDNRNSGQREYFRLVGTYNDGGYSFYPSDRRDSVHWEYMGTTPPKVCGTAWRSSMNLWHARYLWDGVATGDFARAKRGERFLYVNPYLRQVEYFTFLDPKNDGVYTFFPTDGISSNLSWKRVAVD